MKTGELLVVLLATSLAAAAAVGASDGAPSDREIRTRYRAALAAYAEGRVDEAVAAGLALERSSGGTEKQIARLRREQEMVVRSVSRRRPLALVPLATFQLEVLGAATASEDRRLATSGGRLVETILATFVRRRGGRGHRFTAAHLYAYYGAVVHEGKKEIEAGRLYRAALSLEPGLPEALVGLGVVEEKRGRASSARRQFAAGIEAGEEAPSVLLRYGVTSVAVGEVTEGRRALRRALVSASEPWVRIVALEELVRAAALDGDFGAAAELAAAGTEEYPCDMNLRALALLHAERAGRASWSVAPFPPASCPDARPSPRALYNLPPSDLFVRLKEEVAELAARGRPELSRAVGR